MNFTFFVLMIFALIAVVMSVICRAPFKMQGEMCVADGTIEGKCPDGSWYLPLENKCVYQWCGELHPE